MVPADHRYDMVQGLDGRRLVRLEPGSASWRATPTWLTLDVPFAPAEHRPHRRGRPARRAGAEQLRQMHLVGAPAAADVISAGSNRTGGLRLQAPAASGYER
jgi:hypothetical protein